MIRCLISSDLLEEFFWQDYQPSGSGCHDSSSANADPESFESETFVDTHLLEYEPCAEELSKSEAALLAVKLWEVGVVTHLEFGMTHELYVSGSDWATVAAVLDQLPWLELRDEVYYPIRD